MNDRGWNPPGSGFGEPEFSPRDPMLRDATPEEVEPFHIGQCYEHKTAVPAACSICGCIRFEVAFGDYFTALRCPVCGWERCVHDG